MAQAGEDRATDAARTEALVTLVATRWSASLLRCARRWSHDDDDAQDAYQRMMEQLVRWAPRLDPDRLCGWAHTVVKREALALREARARRAESPEEDVFADGPSPEDRVVDLDDLERAAEALAVLKPHELRALWLQAQGLSYKDICAVTEWSYTKVNRCLTEGRRSFLARYRGLEAGEGCARFAEALVAVAGGQARVPQVPGLLSHLRHCGWCRATLREQHVTDAPLSVLLPVAGAGVAEAPREAAVHALARAWETAWVAAQERAAGAAVRFQAAADAVVSGKAAAVAASAAALAGGGAVAVERAAPERPTPQRATAERIRPAPVLLTGPADPAAKVVPRDEVRPLPVVAEQRVLRVLRQRRRAARDAREFAAARARRERARREFATPAPAPVAEPTAREFAGATAPAPHATSEFAAPAPAPARSAAGAEFTP